MTEQARRRRELVRMMEQYTEALIEKAPDALPLAANCRATYNGREIAVGDNKVWHNTLVIAQRQTFVDPVSGEMVFFGVMTNETVERNQDFEIRTHVYAASYHYTVRIKVVDGLITEIEELACNRRLRYFFSQIEEIKLPDLEFEIPIPEEERATREELIAIINAYWDALDRKEGWEQLPIHPDAQRYENGYRTTNHSHSFRGDFKHNPPFRWPTPASTRSFPVVDPTRGLVVSECMLEGGGNIADGGRGMMIVEAFKIKDGAICHLIAHFPLLSGPTGWEK
ncbi:MULTISPECIES: hypothetical protein [unclassified Clostridium]|uniref:hypothetical protein n=1 Tax=unclassified Clostridium TaxID=2614128 RepID=UPI0011063743|nr:MULTISPECIES: hypothetical protein [unclassified Clostridium]